MPFRRFFLPIRTKGAGADRIGKMAAKRGMGGFDFFDGMADAPGYGGPGALAAVAGFANSSAETCGFFDLGDQRLALVVKAPGAGGVPGPSSLLDLRFDFTKPNPIGLPRARSSITSIPADWTVSPASSALETSSPGRARSRTMS